MDPLGNNISPKIPETLNAIISSTPVEPRLISNPQMLFLDSWLGIGLQFRGFGSSITTTCILDTTELYRFAKGMCPCSYLFDGLFVLLCGSGICSDVFLTIACSHGPPEAKAPLTATLTFDISCPSDLCVLETILMNWFVIWFPVPLHLGFMTEACRVLLCARPSQAQ